MSLNPFTSFYHCVPSDGLCFLVGSGRKFE
jgi:hypothetical protein